MHSRAKLAIDRLRGGLLHLTALDVTSPSSFPAADRLEVRAELVSIRARLDDLVRWLGTEGA